MTRSLLLIFIVFSSKIFSQTNFVKYSEEAYYHYQQNDLINAIKNYSKALEFKSEATNGYKIADIYLNRGLCRQMLQSYQGAIADFDEALTIKPEYVKIYQAKTAAYIYSKQYQEALKCANKGLEIKPNDPELICKKGETLSKMKKYDEAIITLKLLLEDNPRNKKAMKFIAHNYQMKKNWDSALKFFSEAIISDPLDYASFYDRGIAYAETKDTTKALKDIRHAMQLDSLEKWVGYNNIAYFIKLEQKDYKGAIGMFDKAIALNPNFPYAYSNRGFAKLQLGDMKGAYQDVKKSLLMDNKNSYAYKNLALIYLKDGKKSDACYNLKKAIELGYTEEYDDDAKNLLAENCK
jgi:tetratricopeptide (TPR) repeat protein